MNEFIHSLLKERKKERKKQTNKQTKKIENIKNTKGKKKISETKRKD